MIIFGKQEIKQVHLRSSYSVALSWFQSLQVLTYVDKINNPLINPTLSHC